ncbi:MAG: c-type cytochrome [SAR324 cluster bacterium]|nr:c-type cytochrome [SAR324 cluster bacterium]
MAILKLFITDDVSIISIAIFILMISACVWLGFFLYHALKKQPEGLKLHSDSEFDGIKEGDGATPFGLHVGMGLAILFGIWYIAFGFKLTKKWAISWYRDEVKAANQAIDDKFKDASDEVLIQMGESVFNTHCVACHGINGKGLDGIAADLTEFGTEKHIIYTIKYGSQGLQKLTPFMPPQWELLGENDEERHENAQNIAAYVLSLGNHPHRVGTPELGRAQFEEICAVCHSPNGSGGGPNGDITGFASNLVEYGTSGYVSDIVNGGKDGIIGLMPVFSEINVLSNIQLKAVSTYVEQSLRR